MFFSDRYKISKSTLRKSSKTNPEHIFRLAKYLRLNIKDMSPNQVAGLVYWRLTREDMID